MVRLTIIIPVYNGEKIIERTTKTYLDFFDKKLKNNYEIIIIPNGCTDNTLAIVRRLSEKYSRIKYFDLGFPGAKGKAVIKGFELASGDLIGFVDADLSSSPKAFYDLIINIKNNDGVIASRALKGAKINIKQPMLRRLLGKVFSLLVRIMLGIKFLDTQCGCKLFKKNAIKKVYSQIIISGWAFDINLLYLMKLNGFKIIEIPTEWKDSGESKLTKKAVPEMFLSILKLRLFYSKFNYLLKLYHKK